jgi:ubiquitin-protein ligase
VFADERVEAKSATIQTRHTSATNTPMASNASLQRINRELKRCLQEPVPLVRAVRPRDGNLYEIHFVITGPEGSPYHDGQYWGCFVLPKSYPNAPPDLVWYCMLTHTKLD